MDETKSLGGTDRIAVGGRREVAFGVAPATGFHFRMFCICIAQKAAVVGRVGVDLDVARISVEKALRMLFAFVEAEIDDDVGMGLVAEVGPEVAGLRLPLAFEQHLDRRAVGLHDA
jgi:hypothetical protein